MMKSIGKLLLSLLLSAVSTFAFAQTTRGLQYARPAGRDGINVFEPPKADTVAYKGFKVVVGADFALQFQALEQSNNADSLVELGSDFNLPTANLNIDAQLQQGVRLHLTTYLSSRHHEEAWVKGGYLQIDNLSFIQERLFEDIMRYTTLRIGMDEFNYGDAHFRRTDNAKAIYNPFVGNYLMDSFSTEVFGEVTVQYQPFLVVVGLTNGKLDQSVIVGSNTDNKPSFYGKLGVDNQVNSDLRLRLTGSWYINQGTSTGFRLYRGDRAGARYYSVLRTLEEEENDVGTEFEGRFNPGFRKLTALQVNPFLKYKGLEFFGIYEIARNNDDVGGGKFTQLAGELLYRFVNFRQLYIGGRYNTVFGEQREGAPDRDITRYNVGGGWFMTDNIVAKAEYVHQQYEGAGWAGTKYAGAEFKGVVLEAAISF